MARSQHLYRRPSGIYFVRLCVPARFKAAVGKGEVHRSTGCRDYSLAKLVAAELIAHWHRAILALQRMDISKVKAGSFELLGTGFVSMAEAANLLGAAPAVLAQQLVARHARIYVQADNWLGWLVDDIDEVGDREHDLNGRVTVTIDPARLGGPETRGPFSGRLRLRYPQEAVMGLQSAEPWGACLFLLGEQHDRGLILDLPGQPITPSMLLVRKEDVESFRLMLSVQITPEMMAGHPSTTALPGASPAGKGAYHGMTLSGLRDEYLKRNGATWKADQIRRRNDQFEVLIDLMGDLSLSEIHRESMRRFADELARVPDERHNVKRKYSCASATFKDLIALADKHNLPRLTTNAQHRLLDGLSEIFGWAVKETMMPSNPAVGLGGELKKSKRGAATKPHEQREKLSDADLAGIFGMTWFANGSGKKTARGVYYAYRPHYYWLPLLALYAGGRLNELSQLYLSDIVTKFGVPCLHFNLSGADKLDLDDGDADESGAASTIASDKSLKTVNADRLVPLHRRLLELGFLEYVQALKAAGYTRLFPELKHDQHKGYGKAAGKWFNERLLGEILRIPRNNKKTFHSMRHNYATALDATRPDAFVKADLMGHTRGKANEGGRYDKGTFEDLKVHIDKISYTLPNITTFNVTEGLRAVEDALKLKSTRVSKSA